MSDTATTHRIGTDREFVMLDDWRDDPHYAEELPRHESMAGQIVRLVGPADAEYGPDHFYFIDDETDTHYVHHISEVSEIVNA